MSRTVRNITVVIVGLSVVLTVVGFGFLLLTSLNGGFGFAFPLTVSSSAWAGIFCTLVRLLFSPSKGKS